MNLVRFDTIDSTNSEALRGNYPEGTIITAEHQTNGRGQRGNSWNSKKSQNLTFSLVHYPNIHLADSFQISMVAALAITDLLKTFGIDSRIKWPNDIYVGNQKIAGILIENSLSGDSIIHKTVIGIGLNVRQTEFPSNIPNPTSMALCGVDVSPENLPEELLSRLTFRFSEPKQTIYSRYRDLMWRKEGYYPYSDAEGNFMAKISDVDIHTGRLSLTREDGITKQYYFKEVRALIASSE